MAARQRKGKGHRKSLPVPLPVLAERLTVGRAENHRKDGKDGAGSG